MRILFILDPVETLSLEWDNSLALVREMMARGHSCWSADTGDIDAGSRCDHARAARFLPVSKTSKNRYRLPQSSRKLLKLNRFDLIVVRKEPPFDLEYYYLTLILDRIACTVPVSNDPAGIRDTNEKLATLLFPRHVPKTIVSSSSAAIAAFQKKLDAPVVVKPLNEKGGHGVKLVRPSQNLKSQMDRLTCLGKKSVMVQESLSEAAGNKDKRIIILDGKILTAYEKHAPRNDFRTNLSLRGTSHPTQLTPEEFRLVGDLRPYLLNHGLHLTGIDVMAGKLIDLNVTCPAGMTEAMVLYPQISPVSAWADYLERLRPKRSLNRQGPSRCREYT